MIVDQGSPDDGTILAASIRRRIDEIGLRLSIPEIAIAMHVEPHILLKLWRNEKVADLSTDMLRQMSGALDAIMPAMEIASSIKNKIIEIDSRVYITDIERFVHLKSGELDDILNQ